MPGFDDDYADIVDYIIRCTHRIWEQKDLGLIETHYSPDCLMHLMTGPIRGADGVIANTARTLAAFPDRTLIGEAVIWSEQADGVYLSSHRITSMGTNLGASDLGPPTGRVATFTTIAECLCAGNRIVEEWLVRDNSAMALSLGLSPRHIARAQAAADQAAGQPADWRLAAIDAIRAIPPSPFPDGALPDPVTSPHDFAHALIDQAWNHRRIGRLHQVYSPAARWQGPGARQLFGRGEIAGWLTAMIGTFGDARFAVHHVAATPCDDGMDIAVRWTMAGRHDGGALYGPASGNEVYVLAVSHWRARHGQIVDDVTVFDEIALLRQIEGGLS